MKLRSFFLILAIVVFSLLLIGTGGFFWLGSRSPLGLLRGASNASPTAAMFVSKQSPVMASLLVNPDRLEAFRRVVALPSERRQARLELAQFRQNLLATTGLNYEQDIQPWVGKELTIAVTSLDIDRDPTNGQQLGYLLAIATQNPERAREFLQLFWQKRALAGTDLIFEQYNGVKLIYSSAAEKLSKQLTANNTQASPKPTKNSKRPPMEVAALSPTLASAIVGNQYVLFANHPKVLREAINNVQAPGLSLSSTEFYKQALDSLTQPRIGLTFVNLPQVANWVAGQSQVKPNPSEKETKLDSDRPPTQMLSIALGLDRQGLVAETALLTPEGKAVTTRPALSQPAGALQYIPEISPFSASGTHLEQFWTQLSTSLKGYDPLAQVVDQSIADLQTRWHLDLPKDVFSWVDGDYALGLVPRATVAVPTAQSKKSKKQSAQVTSRPVLQNDWIFVARSTSEVAKQGIERLDAIAKQQGLSVGPLQLGDQTVSAWTRLMTGNPGKPSSTLALQAQVEGVHASVGSYDIFATSLPAMDQAIKTMPHSLASNDRFQQAIAPFLKPNDGYLYLDWANSRSLLEQQFPLLKVIELAGKPLFDHLQTLTITSYGTEPKVQRGNVFLRLS